MTGVWLRNSSIVSTRNQPARMIQRGEEIHSTEDSFLRSFRGKWRLTNYSASTLGIARSSVLTAHPHQHSRAFSQLSPLGFPSNHWPSTSPLILRDRLAYPRSYNSLIKRFNSTGPTPPSDNEKELTQSHKSSSKTLTPATDQQLTRLQRIWKSVREEASHYWHGTKLLGKEIRLSAKYQLKLLKGKKLTRRERRQVSGLKSI
ncbi:hypothetical protein PGT21_007278 [Puccinia graminis f. sp. tritici]|uniref:Uncharacterized protein n=1 Tax=Puccinia graminis f. sp. tritici TaxID=56615 RepID=A0A5B0LZ70_PUCGR|nr:hypothetical protein PGT21_007278 [Puccinia graminis f. sp. tritici]